MSRRASILVAVAVALAGLVLGIGLDVVDDGDDVAAPAADGCAANPPLVAADQGGDGPAPVLRIDPGGSRSPVTPPGWAATEPSFAPDRERLVVVRAEGESAGPEAGRLWVVGIDGSGARALTAGPGVDSAPAWSPDGARIAFVRTVDGARSVAVVPAEGGAPREVVAATEGVELDGPAWSPDGARLAYVRRRLDPGGRRPRFELWTVAADGTGATGVAEVDPDAVDLDWHPDGGRILVSALSDAGGTLSLVDLASGSVSRLAEGASLGRWSRRGTQVVHHTRVGETQQDVWRLVERPLDGTTLGATRDLGVTAPSLSPSSGVAVAPCSGPPGASGVSGTPGS